jgi:hypothetical protein
MYVFIYLYCIIGGLEDQTQVHAKHVLSTTELHSQLNLVYL